METPDAFECWEVDPPAHQAHFMSRSAVRSRRFGASLVDKGYGYGSMGPEDAGAERCLP